MYQQDDGGEPGVSRYGYTCCFPHLDVTWFEMQFMHGKAYSHVFAIAAEVRNVLEEVVQCFRRHFQRLHFNAFLLKFLKIFGRCFKSFYELFNARQFLFMMVEP